MYERWIIYAIAAGVYAGLATLQFNHGHPCWGVFDVVVTLIFAAIAVRDGN